MILNLNNLEKEYLKFQIIRIDICENCGNFYPKWTDGSKGVPGKLKKNIRKGNAKTCCPMCAKEYAKNQNIELNKRRKRCLKK